MCKELAVANETKVIIYLEALEEPVEIVVGIEKLLTKLKVQKTTSTEMRTETWAHTRETLRAVVQEHREAWVLVVNSSPAHHDVVPLLPRSKPGCTLLLTDYEPTLCPGAPIVSISNLDNAPVSEREEDVTSDTGVTFRCCVQ